MNIHEIIKFIKSSDENKVILFNSADLPKVSWTEILEFVNKHKDERVGQNIVPNVHAFFYNRAERIRSVNKIVKVIHSNFNLDHTDDETLTSQLFGTTIVEDGTSIKKHHDSENNLFWQLKGRSRWMFFDSYENVKPIMDIIVEEGDMIFIPSNTIHYVESESPRAGVAILFNKEK